MATLKLKDINKVYPNGVQAVFDFNLSIRDKEFIVFVGPSGCGKSTTLRMIAGLEEITAGELYIDDELVNDKAPKDRNIAMVFQSYALYPHMTVFDNMAFGLKLRKMPKDIIKEKVQHAAEILGLVPYLDRKPKALSGGQRQRLSIARMIIAKPSVVIFDESTSALDVHTEAKLQVCLTPLLKDKTVITIAHRLSTVKNADLIYVLDDGKIVQRGTHAELEDEEGHYNEFVRNQLL